MAADHEQSLGKVTQEVGGQEEYIIPASEADFVEIARRTSGALFFNEGEARMIMWGFGRSTTKGQLFWNTEEHGEKRLTISIDGGHNNVDISSSGVVMGLDYVAFVDPLTEKGWTTSYVSAYDTVNAIRLPSTALIPLFKQAAVLAESQ